MKKIIKKQKYYYGHLACFNNFKLINIIKIIK